MGGGSGFCSVSRWEDGWVSGITIVESIVECRTVDAWVENTKDAG